MVLSSVGLAAAVGAEDGRKLAGRHRQRNVVQNGKFAVAGGRFRD